jgi:hypothetical protein
VGLNGNGKMMKIAIIDLDSVAFSIGTGNKIIESYDGFSQPIYKRENGRLVYEDKTEEQLKESTDFIMNDIISKGNFTHYIAFIKGVNTIKHKLAIDPTYKQDRPKESPKWWNFVKQDLIDRYTAYQANDYEVDDYVLSTVKQIPNTHICAIDSDILSKEGTHFNWRKNEWITNTKEQEDLAFWQEMICGGHNGNKGLKGKGEKFFNELTQDITHLDNHYLGFVVFDSYVKHYKFDYQLAIDEFYKNYKIITLKTDLDVSMFTPIEWNRI